MTATNDLPLIPDFVAGQRFLAALPLTSPQLAEPQLAAFLDSLQKFPLPVEDLFSLLEQARPAVHFVEGEMSRRLQGKYLPLPRVEEAVFQQMILIWQQLEKAYALCARLTPPKHDDPAYARLIATLLHRCLYCKGMVILEHYRIRREMPAGIWLDLHGYYATAEEWGVATTPVLDELELSLQASHCTAAYVTLLLMDIASPYSLPVRHINLMRRWAAQWAHLVTLHALDDDEVLPPYLVELMQDGPLHLASQSREPGPDARCLETARLGLQMQHMLAQLHQRMTPSQLGLGEENGQVAIQLLSRLSKPWTQASSPRKFRRFPAQGSAQVVTGFEAMYFQVAQKPFEQPESADTYSRDDFDRLFTFRDQAEPGQDLSIRPHVDFPSETWAVINHSANGLRLTRSMAGMPLGHGQLMAVKPHDGDHFLLCRSSWLMQAEDASLVAGLSILPGMPQAIGVHHAASSERYVPAFILSAVPGILEEASLILPPGMYLARGVLEIIRQGEKLQLRMLHQIERGIDYERISYEPA